MPAPKPEELHHRRDYRPRFTDDVHERILQLTAELTRMNDYEPIPRNVIVRTLVERQLAQMGDVNEILEILSHIRGDAA